MIKSLLSFLVIAALMLPAREQPALAEADLESGHRPAVEAPPQSAYLEIEGLSNPVTTIAAGGGHTCALTASGAVKCWGYNRDGQLGDGTTTSRSTPTPVSGLSSGVIAIAAVGYHTCALTASGAALCWGG